MQPTSGIRDLGCSLEGLAGGQNEQLEIADSSWDLLKNSLKIWSKNGASKTRLNPISWNIRQIWGVRVSILDVILKVPLEPKMQKKKG